MIKIRKGFTLIELMVVISIIGILAAIALPAYSQYMQRAEVVDALSMASNLRIKIDTYYQENLEFPSNNLQAGAPAPELLIGNRVTSALIENGAIHVTLGNKASTPLQGKILTMRPAVVTGSPTSPISWLCGFDYAVSGMQAIGDNKTDIDNSFLPSKCRDRN